MNPFLKHGTVWEAGEFIMTQIVLVSTVRSGYRHCYLLESLQVGWKLCWFDESYRTAEQKRRVAEQTLRLDFKMFSTYDCRWQVLMLDLQGVSIRRVQGVRNWGAKGGYFDLGIRPGSPRSISIQSISIGKCSSSGSSSADRNQLRLTALSQQLQQLKVEERTQIPHSYF